MPPDTGVIVVAAGRGTRAGGEVPKQYRPIAGIPMVVRATQPFLDHPAVAWLVLVVPAEHVSRLPECLHQLAAEPRVTIVAGGAERGDSVAAGLASLPPQCGLVLVHDAARPFPSPQVIDAVIECVRRGESALAALPLNDTVKEASTENPSLVARTLSRERLWRAQTPQGFPREVLERAHAAARREGRAATDDAALVEALGLPVRLVPDSPRNLKVTSPEDFALAELLAGLGR